MKLILGRFLCVIALAIWLVELVRYWWIDHYHISLIVLGIGAVLGWVGWSLLAKREAEDAGEYLTGHLIRIVNAIPRPAFLRPAGRRESDGVVIPTAVPAPPAAITPTVTEEHADV
jgi:hypothetical protein